MPVITLQLGQCGNQLGYSFFQALSTELGSGDYHASGLDEWFRQVQPGSNSSSRLGSATHVARSVLIDMEPKVVQSVVSAASSGSVGSGSSRGWWRYPPGRQLCMSSGAGNNWAHGYHGYGPCVREAALDMVRREVEACDVLGGFLLLQSMAGGTGAGLGAYVAHALRDEYPASSSLNCCVWPYESGEVIVQPYNTLLTLSALSGSSDGVVVMENEALHRTAHRLYGVARPSFSDMNLVAARSLTSLLLPSHTRQITPMHSTATNTSMSRAGAGSGPSRSSSWPHAHNSSSSMTSPSAGTELQPQGCCGMGQPVRMLPELLGHVCCHPSHRLLSLRALPQMPAASVDFTTFTWPALTKRLRQMLLTGSSMEEGMDWGIKTTTPAAAHIADMPAAATGCVTPPASRPAPGMTQSMTGGSAAMSDSVQQRRSAGPPGSGGHSGTRGAASRSSPACAASPASVSAGTSRRVNKAVSSWLVLRGQGAADVDVANTGLSDPGLYPSWSIDPVAVSCHPARFARCDMAAALLAADQAAVQPAARMLERAYNMFSSKAYVHQYQAYGLEAEDFTACFAAVEDVVSRYELL